MKTHWEITPGQQTRFGVFLWVTVELSEEGEASSIFLIPSLNSLCTPVGFERLLSRSGKGWRFRPALMLTSSSAKVSELLAEVRSFLGQ
jgi:hypothetical protein